MTFSLIHHMISMLVLSIIHVYLTPVFVFLTFIVNWIIKSCIDGEFRSSTYTERTLQVLLSTIYPITTKRRESERDSRPKQRVYKVKESLGEQKYYYIANLVIVISSSVIYETMLSISREYKQEMTKLQVPLDILVHIVNPLMLLGSLILRAVHHKTDVWQFLENTTWGESMNKMFMDCSIPKPKSSFRVEEDEEIVEMYETKREEEEEDEEDKNSQQDEEEEQEIHEAEVHHEEIVVVSPNQSAHPSHQEREVVIEFSEILAKLKENKKI